MSCGRTRLPGWCCARGSRPWALCLRRAGDEGVGAVEGPAVDDAALQAVEVGRGHDRQRPTRATALHVAIPEEVPDLVVDHQVAVDVEVAGPLVAGVALGPPVEVDDDLAVATAGDQALSVHAVAGADLLGGG